MKIIKKLLIFFILIPTSVFSQTVWKSDGSIVVDGIIKKPSYAERFSEQLKKSDLTWFHATGYSRNIIGYYGEDIFLPGTPLLRMTGIDKGEDYLVSLAKKNGFKDKYALQYFMIANANSKFIDELGLSENEVQNFLKTYSEKKILNNLESLDIKDSKNVQTKISDSLEKQVESKVSEKVENNIVDQIEASFAGWWDLEFSEIQASGETLLITE